MRVLNVRNQHVHSGSEQRFSDPKADATCAAGHEGGLARQILHAVSYLSADRLWDGRPKKAGQDASNHIVSNTYNSLVVKRIAQGGTDGDGRFGGGYATSGRE